MIEKPETEFSERSKISNNFEYTLNTLNLYLAKVKTSHQVLNRYLVNQFLQVPEEPVFLVYFSQDNLFDCIPQAYHLSQSSLQQLFAKFIRPLPNQQRHTEQNAYRLFFATLQVYFGVDQRSTEIIGVALQTNQIIIPNHGIVCLNGIPKLSSFIVSYLQERLQQEREDSFELSIDLFHN